jgi:hypothetical protein
MYGNILGGWEYKILGKYGIAIMFRIRIGVLLHCNEIFMLQEPMGVD